MAEQEPNPDIKEALEGIAANAPDYALYRRYYNGEHRLLFASDKFRNAFGSLFAAFADNLCPTVVDATADRLELRGFESTSGKDEAAIADITAIFASNRSDQRAGQIHTSALRDGDGYAVVWPGDEGTVEIWPNRADQMWVCYSPDRPNEIEYAAKAWNGSAGRRLTLYYADRIEKYIGAKAPSTAEGKAASPGETTIDAMAAGGFRAFEVPGEAWPLLNPFGRVPVFHFANNAEIGAFGRSELHDAIPLQDALNKSICDMLVAMEFNALPQRYIAGIEVDIDPATGQPKPPFQPGADRLWVTGAKDATFGEFSAADLAAFTEVSNQFRAEIARVTGTPHHYLMLESGGAWPSGESLKTAEARFVAKVRDRQVAFGNVWEDLALFALTCAGKSTDGLQISSVWATPEPRSESDFWRTATLKRQAGVSFEQVAREWGYTDAQIKDIAKENAAEADATAERSASAFAGGIMPGGPLAAAG